MKVIVLEYILFLGSLFSLIALHPVVAATHSGSGGARHSSSDHENLLMLARVAVPSNHETGGSNGGAGSPSRSSSVSQGSHRSTSLGRNISRGKSISPRTAPVVQHVAQHHQSEARSSRLSPVMYKKGKRPRSPSPQGHIASPDRSPKSTPIKLFGKVIQENPSSKSPSPKRQTSSNSPTIKLFGKDISSSPTKQTTTAGGSGGGGGSSLFGIDLKKEAAKGKQIMHTSTPKNSPGKHSAGSPNKSPVINLDSDSESGRHVRRRSESPILARHRRDTPESQRTDASFQYSEDSGFGAKSALSRRMPTQMLGQFSTRSQRHATSVRGQNHPPELVYPQAQPGANHPGNHPEDAPHGDPPGHGNH